MANDGMGNGGNRIFLWIPSYKIYHGSGLTDPPTQIESSAIKLCLAYLKSSRHHNLKIVRWGVGTGQKHGGYYSGPDRFDPGTLQAHKWEDAMTVDSGKTCYVQG